MLKTLSQAILIMVSLLVLVSCNKKSKSDNNGTSTQCFYDPYTGGCNNTLYNNYSAYGYQAYPYGQMPGYSSDPNSMYRYQLNSYYSSYYGAGNSQLCSCPQGSRPVYNGMMGTGCVAQNAIPHYSRTYYWSWSAGSTYNNHYVNMPQMSNINGSLANGGCYNNVAWSCLVGQANQCPSGTTCAATAQNSPIGVCIK